ncbi:hypothetical protein EOPP23_00795 [Endozoicomonas sp. OPT23]|uniref:transcription termination/antitermination NusG family protein n=1 Tax=Endozoicomonas sp. OPT23 TaxID=2072845 RepID=UPI00129AD5FB|nr:transcription termination/antitermination NusG family protein [Endozoicomonas sp. OPT23]MRI31528.1 hypothetical protein [Endozoicomonas sp. OPT23]
MTLGRGSLNMTVTQSNSGHLEQNQGEYMQEGMTLQEGWYLLKTKSKQEAVAFDNLEAQGFDAYNPEIKVRKKGLLKEEALFPGYIFLYLDLHDLTRYHKIRSTRGVSEMVYFNRVTRQLHRDGRLSKAEMQNDAALLPRPVPNGEHVIETIKSIVALVNDEAEGKSGSSGLKKGDKVIVDHPLYKNLEMTFMYDVGCDRGAILIQHIKQQRCADGSMTNQIVSRQEVTVRKKDLQKVG